MKSELLVLVQITIGVNLKVASRPEIEILGVGGHELGHLVQSLLAWKETPFIF